MYSDEKKVSVITAYMTPGARQPARPKKILRRMMRTSRETFPRRQMFIPHDLSLKTTADGLMAAVAIRPQLCWRLRDRKVIAGENLLLMILG
jgi:hypothetical protein